MRRLRNVAEMVGKTIKSTNEAHEAQASVRTLRFVFTDESEIIIQISARNVQTYWVEGGRHIPEGNPRPSPTVHVVQ